jgi:recombination protein RecT
MGNGLAERVNARAQVARRGGGEVEQRERPTLRKQIEDMHEQFAMAMPRGFEAQQLIRDAMTLLRQNPDLAECVPETVLGGLMTFAQLGLRPGVMGQGWLIPFKNWKKGNRLEAQIVIGYQGYVELVHRSGAVKKIVGRAVHANDEFHVEFGLDEKLVHRPAGIGKERGPVVAYYAVLFFHDADPLFWVMTREEAIAWRDHHAMGTKRFKGEVVRDNDGNAQGAGPWFDMDGPDGGTGFDQMAIKTCFLRAKRWAPKSTDRLLTAATEVDGAVRLSYKPAGQDDYDEMLTARHPEPEPGRGAIQGAVIDVETDDDTNALRDVDAAATVPAPREDDVPPPPEPPASTAAAPAADEAISRAMTTQIGRLIGAGGVGDDAGRKLIASRLAGRSVPVGSTSELSRAEGLEVIRQLTAAKDGGRLQEFVAEVLGATDTPAAEAPAGDLPTPGTAAWHEAGHPTKSDDGRITTVPVLMNGECGLCEEPDPRDEESFEG